MKKILLLGSGELGKELTISLQRLGCYLVACDRYKNAPAMQVSQEYEVFDMLNSCSLKKMIAKHKPNIIVPEIEAIDTESIAKFEKTGLKVLIKNEKKNKGTITFSYHDNDQLNKIIDIIKDHILNSPP